MVYSGDMRELGKEAQKEHKKIVDLLEDIDTRCITIGAEFSSFSNSKIVNQFYTTDDAINFLEEHPITDALILLKGSRGIGLEKLERIL